MLGFCRFCAFCAFCGLQIHFHDWGFEVLDEAEEDVDVDGFGDESQIAGVEGALSIFFTGIAGDSDGRDVAESWKNPELFEELIAVNVRHADIGNDDVRAVCDRAVQCLCG